MVKIVCFKPCNVYHNKQRKKAAQRSVPLIWGRDRSPGGSDGKESTFKSGDPGLIPGLGRSLGEWSGNPLQYSCLENSMDGGAWWARLHGVTESWTQLTLALFTAVLGILHNV